MGSNLYFPINIRTGLIKTELFLFLARENEVVLVHIDNKKHQEILRWASAQSSGGYLSRMGSMFSALSNYGQQLAALPSQQILEEHVGSIVLSGNAIERVSLIQRNNSDEQNGEPCGIQIKTSGGKYQGTVDKAVDILAVSAGLAGMLGRKFSRT